MLKEIILILLIICNLSSINSNCSFKSTDSNNDNYIHISKLIKDNITGNIYMYSNEQKAKFNYRSWLSSISLYAIRKDFNIPQRGKRFDLTDFKGFDEQSRDTNLIIACYTNDATTNLSEFNLNSIKLEVKLPNRKLIYNYKNVKNSIQFYKYDKRSNNFVTGSGFTNVSCIVINLEAILKSVISEDSIEITIQTTQGDETFKIK